MVQQVDQSPAEKTDGDSDCPRRSAEVELQQELETWLGEWKQLRSVGPGVSDDAWQFIVKKVVPWAAKFVAAHEGFSRSELFALEDMSIDVPSDPSSLSGMSLERFIAGAADSRTAAARLLLLLAHYDDPVAIDRFPESYRDRVKLYVERRLVQLDDPNDAAQWPAAGASTASMVTAACCLRSDPEKASKATFRVVMQPFETFAYLFRQRDVEAGTTVNRSDATTTLKPEVDTDSTAKQGSKVLGFLGGAELAEALGIPATRSDSFMQALGRKRNELGDETWHEVCNSSANSPRFLYRVDSQAIQEVARKYRS